VTLKLLIPAALLVLAMQKVEGSSPFIRSQERPAKAGLFCFLTARQGHKIGLVYHFRLPNPVSRGASKDRRSPSR